MISLNAACDELLTTHATSYVADFKEFWFLGHCEYIYDFPLDLPTQTDWKVRFDLFIKARNTYTEKIS